MPVKVTLTDPVQLNPHHWLVAIRRVAVYVHRLGVATGLEAEREAAPELTGALKKSIIAEDITPAGADPSASSEAIISRGRSELMSAIITTKPQAHLSWVKTAPIIRPVSGSVLVFPILPGWKPKRTKRLGTKEQDENKVIVAWVRGRPYNRWRERGMQETAKRLRRALGRLRLRVILEV